MVFVAPDVPRWTPTTEADIEQAIADGILAESHWWDAKRQLNPGPKVNKAFAADLAAFAIDGGSLLIGLHENKETGTFTLAPQPIAGLPERIGSIAATAVDPPLYVVTTPIPSKQTGENGEQLGYLLIEVPPSARAPHQVDGVYSGRGDKQNVRLSDAEVRRHHALRESLEMKATGLLMYEVGRDPVAKELRTNGHVYLIAEPLTSAPDAASRFLRSDDAREWIGRRVINEDASNVPMRDQTIPPNPQNLTRVEARSNGLAVTTEALAGTGRRLTSWDSQALSGADDYLLDVEFLHNGGLRVVSGRATMGNARNDSEWVLDQLIVAHTCRLLAWATRIGEAIGYRGSWLLGVQAEGLAGLPSAVFHNEFSHRTPPRFSASEYRSVTTATLQELVGQPWAVMSRLVENLVWSLGTAPHFRSVLEAPTEG